MSLLPNRKMFSAVPVPVDELLARIGEEDCRGHKRFDWVFKENK